MSKATIDNVIAKYIETRDEIAKLEHQKSDLKALQDKREQWLASQANKDNQQGGNYPHGGFHFQTQKSVTTADKKTFQEWCIVNEIWEAIDFRPSKSFVVQQVDEGRSVPPGVNYTTVRKVIVTRPKGTGKDD